MVSEVDNFLDTVVDEAATLYLLGSTPLPPYNIARFYMLKFQTVSESPVARALHD